MKEEDFMIKLKELCLRYDTAEGDWPENKYEGCALWRFANNDYSYSFKVDYEHELDASE